MKKICLLLVVCFSVIIIYAQPRAIRVETSGKGQPVIYLPGFTCPGAVWQETIGQVKGNYQHHVVSYAGFNGMAPVAMPWYEQIKKELLEYIRAQQLSQVVIIGHSMGGTLGLDLASELPNAVAKLLVVDGLPCMRALMMPGVNADMIQYKSPYNDQLLKMSDSAFALTAKQYAQQMTNNAAKRPLLEEWIKKADRETYVYGYTDLLKSDIRPRLSAVKAEVLVLGASFPSKEVVEKTYQEQFANMSAKTIEIVPNSRHFLFFDQPEWFYKRVNTFLSR